MRAFTQQSLPMQWKSSFWLGPERCSHYLGSCSPQNPAVFCSQFSQGQDRDCRRASVFMDWLLSSFAVLITLYILEIKTSFLIISVTKALQHFQVQRGGEASDQRLAVMSCQRQAQGDWGQKDHHHAGSQCSASSLLPIPIIWGCAP